MTQKRLIKKRAFAMKGQNLLKQIGRSLVGEINDKAQLLTILRDVQLRNVISSEALSMIEGVMDVTDMQVREVMIPRSQMVVIKSDATVAEIIPHIIDSAHSRFPVIGENRDDVDGIILAKDMLNFFTKENHDTLDLREYMRPAVFIPESKRLNVLLKDFRVKRNHIAIVIDEYGGVSGLVTIEDVLEEIVGEIEDEYDVEEEANIVSHGKGIYVVQALTELDDFNDFFKSSLNSNKFETIGGIIMNAFGYMPQRGEEITLGKLLFKVTRADHRRIYQFKVSKIVENISK